jgi:pimeloyl-ACP methyl ester carboxylesterase
LPEKVICDFLSVMAVTLPEPVEERTVRSAGGRTLAVARWGRPGGAPVIAHHGTPMCRLDVPGTAALWEELDLDLVTFDRPGYGRSTAQPGRTVADAAADAAAVADVLGLERFAVHGVSGGGPHALACAALLGGRVTRTASVVGLGPFDAPGLDFRAGLTELNVAEFEVYTQGRAALEAYVGEFVALTRANGAAVMDEWDAELPEPDRLAWGTPEARALSARALTEALAASGAGWVDDGLAFIEPWGFALEDIRSPVAIWAGALDRLVPLGHALYMAARIPEAELHVVPDRGHALDDAPILGWLAGRG